LAAAFFCDFFAVNDFPVAPFGFLAGAGFVALVFEIAGIFDAVEVTCGRGNVSRTSAGGRN